MKRDIARDEDVTAKEFLEEYNGRYLKYLNLERYIQMKLLMISDTFTKIHMRSII